MILKCEDITQEHVDNFIEDVKNKTFEKYKLLAVEPDRSLFKVVSKLLGGTKESILIIVDSDGLILFLNTVEKSFPMIPESIGSSWTEAYKILLTQSIKNYIKSKLVKEDENSFFLITDKWENITNE